MLLVWAFEVLITTLVLYLGVTQVILPLWRNTPLFPMLREERRLKHELSEATEEVVEAELEQEIARTNRKAETIRRVSGSKGSAK